ncbi:hypothetical protein ACRQ5Q_14480 [Bradyrhizobium sp. PMVTL-01]|uniref:hypothetical protein n=1 Tax=Bradyrhizobium sp. PMVTL-01 TaxID=3434999 RepID=UPI003F704B35
MKPCSECAAVKPLDDFYKHPSNTDGRANICKDCHKKRMKLRRQTNPAVQAYDRERAKRPERIAAMAANTKRWRSEHPEAYRAQNAVNNAIRDGNLTKHPCCVCLSDKDVHAHHTDYSRPLDVKWLCAGCHHRIHAHFPHLGGHYQEASS